MSAWLVIVDPQVVFADESSAWAAEEFGSIITKVNRLVEVFGERTIVTRWVPSDERPGSWETYFEHYPFADRTADDPLFDLVPEAEVWVQGPTLDVPTFGKWGPAMEAITGPAPELVLAGVATDCCVISTALAAADAGCSVTIASDACAGSSGISHEAALHVMGLYEPQIYVRTTKEICAGA